MYYAITTPPSHMVWKPPTSRLDTGGGYCLVSRLSIALDVFSLLQGSHIRFFGSMHASSISLQQGPFHPGLEESEAGSGLGGEETEKQQCLK